MSSRDFKPKLIIERTIRRWPLLFMAMLLGGAAAYGVSALLPPRYEAVAQVTTNIDYTIAPEIDDHLEDRAINEAGWLMVSYKVLGNVLSSAEEEGMDITYQDIKDTFSVERIDDLWTLRVVGPDPEDVVALANIWVEEAYAQLDEAAEHAQAASVLGTYLTSLEDCLDALPDEGGSYALCTADNVDDLAGEIEEKTLLLNKELELSRAIHPAARYALVSYAQVPVEPVFHTRGTLVFSGALLGLVIALAWLFIKNNGEQ
jgi:uncharacterized protein involved in exopolysaccharide biosynthesis